MPTHLRKQRHTVAPLGPGYNLEHQQCHTVAPQGPQHNLEHQQRHTVALLGPWHNPEHQQCHTVAPQSHTTILQCDQILTDKISEDRRSHIGTEVSRMIFILQQ